MTDEPTHLSARLRAGTPEQPRIAPAEEMRIFLLGGFRVQLGSRWIDPAEWYLRKVAALVKFLALAPGHQLPRDQILAQLWPELEPEIADTMLDKALHIAQQVLEPALISPAASSYLRARGELLFLRSPGTLWVDVEALQAAVREAAAAQTPVGYEEALCLYQGDLLPEDEHEDWTRGYRQEVRGLRLQLTQNPRPRAPACPSRIAPPAHCPHAIGMQEEDQPPRGHG